jgi:protein-S-isoprenylcysteine O-methyltransferase Ste14
VGAVFVTQAREEASSPRPWPPIVTGALLLAGAILTYLAPLSLPAPLDNVLVRGFGWGVIVASFILGVAAVMRFRAAGTPIPVTEPTRMIVGDGVYAFTRNPIYLGMVMLLFGIGLASASLWFLLAAVVAIVALTKLAIEREEAYLERNFGQTYRDYKTRVRRWI